MADLIPIAKDGKFLGYADAKQVQKHNLEIFDETKAASAAAAKTAEKQKVSAAEAKKAEDEAASKGADPAAVKKGPAR